MQKKLLTLVPGTPGKKVKKYKKKYMYFADFGQDSISPLTTQHLWY